MWTLTSRRAPSMPTGAPMPSWSSTTKSCGSTCRISRPVGSETAFAASIARRTSSRVISRFLPATAMTPRLLNPLMCGPDRPRWTESISTPAISSASSIAFLIASTAASTFTTTPRRMPADSATPMPTTSRPPLSSTSPTTAVTFDVPTSRPTTYLSLRATEPPVLSRLRRPCRHCALSRVFAGRLLVPKRVAAPGRARRGRAHVDPVVEPQVHGIDVRNAFPQRRLELQVRLDTLDELVLADVDDGAIVVEDDSRVVNVAHVHLR